MVIDNSLAIMLQHPNKEKKLDDINHNDNEKNVVDVNKNDQIVKYSDYNVGFLDNVEVGAVTARNAFCNSPDPCPSA